MSLISTRNTLLAELNTLKGDHEALLEKHRRLSLNTQSLVDRVSLSENGQKIAENNLGKAEAALKAAEFTISADTDELRDRLEKEHKNRKEKFKKEINDLYATITENSKLFKRLNTKYDDATADWARERNKLVEKITEITTLENKMNTIVGKVVSAKNKITSLNSNTPYRPGAVERTLADVMEDLRNV